MNELQEFIAEVETERKSITVYSSGDASEITQLFATRNVSVEHRSLPEGRETGFVVLRDADEFVGSIGIEQLEELLSPPIHRPWDDELFDEAYRGLFELFDNTTFASFDRRQMLATAREIEERAWRVGHGTLRVGFQSFFAAKAQVPVYIRFSEETELDIHIYGEDDWEIPEAIRATVHPETSDEIGRFWLVAFDGDGDDMMKCALMAEERSEDQFYGFWTYDPATVDELLSYLEQTYG